MQAARRALTQAWQTAAFVRTDKMPPLNRLLAKIDRRKQTPEQERARWLDWARSRGFKVEHHDQPVLPTY